jgi:hypothetical protein
MHAHRGREERNVDTRSHYNDAASRDNDKAYNERVNREVDRFEIWGAQRSGARSAGQVEEECEYDEFGRLRRKRARAETAPGDEDDGDGGDMSFKRVYDRETHEWKYVRQKRVDIQGDRKATGTESMTQMSDPRVPESGSTAAYDGHQRTSSSSSSSSLSVLVSPPRSLGACRGGGDRRDAADMKCHFAGSGPEGERASAEREARGAVATEKDREKDKDKEKEKEDDLTQFVSARLLTKPKGSWKSR